LKFNELKWNTMTNMSGDMAETSVADFFITGERVHQCLDPTMPQKWSGPPDPWTGWKLTPMITFIL